MANDEFTAKFKVDISDLKKNITEANKEIKLANATFKAETAGMDKWSKDADGLSSKLKQLDKVLESQKKILSSYKEQLEKQKKAYDENGERAEKLRAKLKELADNGVSKTSDEYKKYESALKDCVREQAKNEKAVDDLNVQVLEQEAAVKETERGIRHYSDSLDDLGNEADNTGDAISNTGDGFTVFKGVLSDLVSTAIKEAIKALKELADAAVEAYVEFDEGADNIVKRTGATGEAAEQLMESYKNVASSVVGDLSDIGDAVGEVNTRFGLTGSDLDNVTEKFLKFSELNDTDVASSIDKVQSAMTAFGLEAEDAGDVLDILNKAAQDTGVPMDQLMSSLQTNATALQEMGFGINTATGFLANLEKNGVSSSEVMGGMKKALQNATKEGKPLSEALAELQEKMAGAETDTEAAQYAMELFGNKAGPAIAKAVQEGRLSFDELSNSVTNFGGSVDGTYSAIMDVQDSFALLGQTLKVQVGDTISQFLEQNGPAIEGFMNAMAHVIIPAVVGALTALLSIVTFVIQIFVQGWNAIKAAWQAAPAFFSSAWGTIKNTFSNVSAFFGQVFGNAWNAIKQKFANWSSFWGNLWTQIKNKFTNIGTSISNAISRSVKSGLNGVISSIERVINNAIGIINGAINLINKIPGVSVGNVGTIHLPRLARGGVLKRGEVGLLEGNGAEAVVPLERNKKWIHAVTKDLQQEMQRTGAGLGGIANSKTNSFTQNIYAPQAPSRIELYRQTKNLLALVDGRT